MIVDKVMYERILAEKKLRVIDILKAGNLTKNTLANVSKGKNMRPLTVRKIADALGVDVADIQKGV
jgi:DNA-binding Xre family transcriptional regulator